MESGGKLSSVALPGRLPYSRHDDIWWLRQRCSKRIVRPVTSLERNPQCTKNSEYRSASLVKSVNQRQHPRRSGCVQGGGFSWVHHAPLTASPISEWHIRRTTDEPAWQGPVEPSGPLPGKRSPGSRGDMDEETRETLHSDRAIWMQMGQSGQQWRSGKAFPNGAGVPRRSRNTS